MCCDNDPKTKREFIKSLKGRKTFTAWKELRICHATGKTTLEGTYSQYPWKPGVNETKQMKRYSSWNPTGFHVYLKQPHALDNTQVAVVAVTCHVDDLWRIEMDWVRGTLCGAGWSPAFSPQQAVIRNKVTLKHKDYKKAIEDEREAREAKVLKMTNMQYK